MIRRNNAKAINKWCMYRYKHVFSAIRRVSAEKKELRDHEQRALKIFEAETNYQTSQIDSDNTKPQFRIVESLNIEKHKMYLQKKYGKRYPSLNFPCNFFVLQFLGYIQKKKEQAIKTKQAVITNKIQVQKTELSCIPEEDSGKKQEYKTEQEKLKPEKTKFDFSQHSDPDKENDSSLSNIEELPLVNWYEQHYKQRSKLIPKLSADSKISTVAIKTSFASEKKEQRDCTIISIKPEPEFVLPEKELEDRLAKYRQLLDEFNIGKVKLKKLKAQSQSFSNVSLTNEISKTQTKLQEKRSQIQSVLQEITLLKQNL